MTYLCLLDESGRQVRPEGWFLYGACAIESDHIWALHRKIVRIRNRAGFRSRTPFKWTRPTAQSISAAAHNRAADELLDACREEAVRMFIAMVPSVLTTRTSRDNTSVRYGIGYSLTFLQQFLEKVHDHGIVSVDTFAGGNSLPIIEQVLAEGRPAGMAGNERTRKFGRILVSAVSSIRSTVFGPMIDVPLGAFGFCLSTADIARARDLYARLKFLINRGGSNGTPWNHGLRIRPIEILYSDCSRLALRGHDRLVALGEKPAPLGWRVEWDETARHGPRFANGLP